MRHCSLAVSLALLTLLGCDRSQPLEPTTQARSPSGASTVTAPSNTNAVVLSESRVDVSWRDNSTNETGFEVHRSTAGASGAFMLLASIGTGNTGYSDGGLTPSTQYCYKVRAFRTANRKTTYSGFSNTACATTAPPPPVAPSGADSKPVNSTTVDVGWIDNSTNEDGFEVHRSIAGASGAYALLAATGAGVTSYGDAGLSPSTQYCYKVRAFRTTGSTTSYSEFSPSACATTLASEPPAAPTIWVAEPNPFNILLWFFEDSDNEDGFKVERCVGVVCGDPDFAVIAVYATTGPRDHFFQDWHVVPGTTYTYRVRAFNSAGDSAPSNQASATACFVEVDTDGFYACSGF